MKYLLTLVLSLLLVSNGYAWDKEKTINRIKEAQQAIIAIDNNLELRPYIPFDIYSDALIDLLMSRTQIKFENYITAYYHASQSMIKLQTLELMARAEQYRHKLLVLERDYYKKNQTNPGYVSIVKASLQYRGNVFYTYFLDKKIFLKNSMALNLTGKTSIDRVIEVLKHFPKSKVKIIGYTRYKDYKNLSQKKTIAICNYMKANGIDQDRITYIGMGNSEVMETALGYKRIDRIEIIISGIE